MDRLENDNCNETYQSASGFAFLFRTYPGHMFIIVLLTIIVTVALTFLSLHGMEDYQVKLRERRLRRRLARIKP